ncbi:serine dehydratase subunit alpha family protein [Caloranaerobacter ferrireducens]|uniref:L-cysteine desulfidase family protein n=1 Tax=Caloranaerobacter ferrireducens TaxID=1323370 RepID=UPI00084DFC06|nr:L-serine ammonia-lyase, iron-sulfur-dependent, subunit alpha [Caloranaerobacter ferrireducens]
MNIKDVILDTLKKEVVPAIGCTEPVAVALACAKAKELLESDNVIEATILVSPNIYKNGLGVGIPNTNEIGLDIAAALGVVGGKAEKDLRVLENIPTKKVGEAKEMLKKGIIKVGIKNTQEKVYIEVNLKSNSNYSKVIIREKHNSFTHLETDGKIIFQKNHVSQSKNDQSNELFNLKIRDIIKEIEEIEPSKLEFLLEGIEMNEKIANIALENKIGIGVGYSIYESIKNNIIADDLINTAAMLTAAASDARMSGLNMPVMSSNGSGNNGLTAILPIAAYKKKYNIDNEKIAKALAISHIINCYVKHYIGRLSALCGCAVAAATGSGAAIAWLMGANSNQIDGVIKNMVANLSGMICDGAKVSCAFKLATAASTAVQSALLAVNDSIALPKNGIVAESAEETIRNLGILSRNGMNTTDKVILEIMSK